MPNPAWNKLEAQSARVPRRIPVGEIVAGDVVQLATERKHLTDVIKMVAYQVETDLVRRITPYYHRADDEARTLVHTASVAGERLCGRAGRSFVDAACEHVRAV